MRNTSSDHRGQAGMVAVFTPILDGHETSLREHLKALPVESLSPLARVPGTHFGRWLVISELVYQGPPQRRDPLGSAYLVFTAAFDGMPDSYLDRLGRALGTDADQVWQHCVGYPGSADRREFADYLGRHVAPHHLFFPAYPAATVAEVTAAVDLQQRFTAFAVRAQDAPTADRREDFLALFRSTP